MKKVPLALGVMALSSLLVLVGCLDQTGPGGTPRYQGPLFRYHYGGRTHLPTGTNAVAYRAIDALPVTAELRAEVAQKFAQATLRFWSKDLPPGVTDQSALLRPLFDDLMVAPALVEVRGPVGNTETVVAIELSEDRSQLWNVKLRQLATAWRLGTPKEISAEGARGWETKRAQAPSTLQFLQAGQWVFLGLGQDPMKALLPLLTEARKNGRPLLALRESFLEMSVDFPALKAWFPILGRYPLPAAVASMSARGEQVRTDVRLHYAQRIPWKPEPWRLPTNFVGEPLTSFTAMQGVAALLQAVKGPMDLGLNPLPNQAYLWGISHPQCRIYFAVPVAEEGSKVMNNVALKLPKFIASTVYNARGDFFYNSNRSHLAWVNLPHVIPVIAAEKDGNSDFLVGGDVPLPGKRTPVPDQLFAQVRGRTNLLYYDWEYTQERVTHGKQFYQLACLATGRPVPSTNSVAKRWLSAITPLLTNTATEVTYVGPQELGLARKSDLGLTGFEIATLSTWIDSPGFPLDFSLPPVIPFTTSDSLTHRMTSAVPRSATGPLKPLPAKAATNGPLTAPKK
ncbi:MAG TPA: hypothetical protein VNU68_11565 [Verrucomicrobiae bacterium]|nr:hypothetical protein [Verrucomicrobiae bacterium]